MRTADSASRRSETRRALAGAGLILLSCSTVEIRATEKGPKSEQKGPNRVWEPASLNTRAAGGPYAGQGPGPLLQGQVEGMPGQPVVGAVEALAAHPTDSNIVWAGSVNGGIWKTTNALAATPSWTNQTPTLHSLSISAIEVDPTVPGGTTLYAAFDRRSAFRSLGGALNGVLKTTDGGGSWVPVGNLSGRNVSGLAPRGSVVVASVANPNTCADLGIWRSTDSGATFTHVSSTAALPCGRTYDLAGDPVNPAHLVTVLTQAPNAADRGIWRSTDAGATWTKAATPFDARFETATFSRVELAVGWRGTPDNGGASGANLFFAACTTDTTGKKETLAGLFGSASGGTSWAEHDLPSTPDPAAAPMGLHPGGQCRSHLSITADPFVHSVVYVGGDRQPFATEGSDGADYFPNSSGAMNYTGRLFRSDFTLATGSQTYPVTHCQSAASPGCGGVQRTASNSAPHADSRELLFLPNGQLVEADDGGVYRNSSPSSAAGDWVSMNGNLAVQEQHDSAYDGISRIVLSGNQDTGSGQQSATGSFTWSTLAQGDGGDVAVGRNDPAPGQSTRYSSSQSLGGLRREVYNSAGEFVSRAYPSLALLAGSPEMAKQFVSPLVVNATAPARLVIGAENGVYESADRGDSVTRITETAVNYGDGGPAIAYGVNANADALYVASDVDVLVRLEPSPAAPTRTSPGGTAVRAVAVDPGNAQRAFAVTESAVYTTSNAGAVWTDVTANLAASDPGDFRSVAYIPGGPGDFVAVGTDRGVFHALLSSLGSAPAWERLGTGLPNAPVFDLAYDQPDDVLTAGTMGRGTFRLAGVQGGATPDFQLSVSPAFVSAGSGSVATASVGCGASGGFAATVSLSAANLPSGASAAFSPTSITCGAGTSTLTLSTGSAAEGSYTVVVTGAGGGLTHSANLGFTVAGGGGGGGGGSTTLFVPVVLKSSGASSSFYTSELTLTNRGSAPAAITFSYTAAAGGGSGSGTASLPAGRQLIVPDAIDYLIARGVPIPESGNRVGTLRVKFDGVGASDVAVLVRTTTPVPTTAPTGAAGLAYTGIPTSKLPSGPVVLCGLRRNALDRTNIAVQNAGDESEGSVGLRIEVFLAEAGTGSVVFSEDVTLSSGGFRQVTPPDFSSGYARVTRTSGSAPYYAYAVINDNVNSDGSFVLPVEEASLGGTNGLTLPVALEASVYSTEAVFTNLSAETKTLKVRFFADALGASPAEVNWNFVPGEQYFATNIVNELRASQSIPTGVVGPIFVTVAGGSTKGVFVGARTGNPGGGGRYALFYSAVPYGAASTSTAWINGLQQNPTSRSNLALVNTGELDSSSSSFLVEIFDGDSGTKTGETTLTVAAKRFLQVNAILDLVAPGTTNAYARVTRTSGTNPFVTYGVINDGGIPGQRSGDGAFVLSE